MIRSMRARGASPQRRHVLVAVLTVAAGATDAIGFLALGGAFTSVMTGNLVLFGISVGGQDGELAARTVAAIVCFVAGCVVGARLAGTARDEQAVWPREVTRALLVEMVVLIGYAVGWWTSGSHPGGVVQLVLLAVTAIALGIQSSSVQRFGVPGLSTTYMTGTLTTMVVRLTSGHRVRDVADSLRTLAALVCGALVAMLLVKHAPVFAPVLQLSALGIVLVVAVTVMRPAHDPVLRTPG